MKKNLYIGGYSILDLADTNVYNQALICAKQNKPVLVYDDPLRYYADTIAIDTDNDNNVVITKGGKTITINDNNSVSSVGEIQPSSEGSTIHYYALYYSSESTNIDLKLTSDKSLILNDLTTRDLRKYLVSVDYTRPSESGVIIGFGFYTDSYNLYIKAIEETEDSLSITEDTISLATIKTNYTLTEIN